MSSLARPGRGSFRRMTLWAAPSPSACWGPWTAFTPILNAPQSAILGVGRSVQKPVVKGGDVVVREMLTVSLTADHQVIDGAVAASFMRRLQATVERPAPLFRQT